MTIAVDHQDGHRLGRSLSALGSLGWLAMAGGASLGAGAIHAAAIGVHAEHRQAVVVFTIVAAIQLGWGALALTRPGPVFTGLGALANAGAFAGWVLTKTVGIGFVAGLDVAEAPQMADALAAGLAVAATIAAVAHLGGLGGAQLRSTPVLTGGTAVLVAVLAVPGMFAAGSHTHAGDHGAGNASTGGAHQHATDGPGIEGEGEATNVSAAPVPPRPYDPTLPIDLGGVPGVTPQQQAAAENLLAITVVRLPQFADVASLGDNGFFSIGDGFLGHEHYLNHANMNDDKVLDPDHPESLVFDTSVSPKRLVAAMYMLRPGDTLDDVPELGGALTQWHIHDNLCTSDRRLAGLTDAEGRCPPGTEKFPQTPMMHVWIEPNRCGPFAALEGIAGGTIREGEERLCDHVHG